MGKRVEFQAQTRAKQRKPAGRKEPTEFGSADCHDSPVESLGFGELVQLLPPVPGALHRADDFLLRELRLEILETEFRDRTFLSGPREGCAGPSVAGSRI